MLRLHTPDEIFSIRHVPSWLLLCGAAGATNGLTLLACERFVTHVTGTVTRLGTDVMRLEIALDFALVLIAFIAGAMFCGTLLQGRAHQNKRPYFSLPLWLTAALVGLVALAGHAGWFGPFGSGVDEPRDFLLLCALSFAMGLQNAAVATSTGQLVRTTHLTGPATDLGVHLAELMYASGAAQKAARRNAALRTGKIVAYALGAAFSLPLGHRWEFLGFLVPALVVALATLLSFAHKDAALAREPAGA